MINLAWGGVSNGRLTPSQLVQVTSKPDYLEYSTATWWLKMVAACRAATGRTLSIAPGSSAYRSYDQQVYFYDQYLHHGGNVAAVPGTSNHGYGRAIDITGYESSPAVWAWLQANAVRYGFSWATGQASGERWHWESLNTPQFPPTSTAGGSGTIIKPAEEIFMKDAAFKSTAGATVYLYIVETGGVRVVTGPEWAILTAADPTLKATELSPTQTSAIVNGHLVDRVAGK